MCQPESPLPGRVAVWEASAAVSELRIFGALDRDHAGARGGRAGDWKARVPGVLGAIMLAVRALVLRFGLHGVCPWELAVCLTGGLLYGRPPPAP